MGPSWALAFLAAAALVLAVTPLVRKLALAVDFVDYPGDHKTHAEATPYLGGIALAVAVLAAVPFVPDPSPEVAVVAIGAALMATLGLLDDHRTVHPAYRFLAECATAAAVVLVGLRVHATGIVAIDVAITVVWIVGVTNAVNLLDNMDGLAAGVTAAAGSAILVLAVVGNQGTTATLAAGLVGACVAFLFHNRPPALIFMGDAGSLFLGFVLAVLTIDVNPSLGYPASFIVPLMLLALPVLDTTTVTIARLRHGLNPSQGGRDHLSHRLIAQGMSRGWAVTVLVTVELVLGAVAVVAGRHRMSLGLAVVAASCVLGALVLASAWAPVYAQPVVGLPRVLRRGLWALGIGMVLAAVPAVVAVVGARHEARTGAQQVALGLRSLEAGDAHAATLEFAVASRSLHKADQRLNSPLTSLGLAVPGVASNLRASRTIVDIVDNLARAGNGLSAVADSRRLPLSPGSVPIDGLRRLSRDLDRAARVMKESADLIGGADRPYLLPDIRDAVHDLDAAVTRARSQVQGAAELTRAIPAIAGADGPRRYLLAVQDDTDMRATGGTVLSRGELRADGGHLTVENFELDQDVRNRPRPAADGVPSAGDPGWQWVNSSPDFPTSARAMADLYARSGRGPVDGVVSIDLPGLAALLDLSGPVRVASSPEPISGSNLLEITTTGAVERFPDPAERDRFRHDVAAAVLSAFTTADLGDPMRLAAALHPAVAAGHLRLFLARPGEEGLAATLGADGRLGAVGGDSLLVVNQALSLGGTDSYLHRDVRYRVRIDPDRRPATVVGELEVVFRNDLPITAAGAADNQTHLSVYSPFSPRNPTLDGQPLRMQTTEELGRHVHSAPLVIPPQGVRTFRVDLEGRVELGRGGWLALDLLHQASLSADSVDVSVSIPDGWRIADVNGLRRDRGRGASARLRQGEDSHFSLRLERTGLAGIWDRLSRGI